jgi:pimeloyl-[acyl-carrier protein] methyl ester esterase
MSGLVLVSATPRFTVTDDWPHGQQSTALDELASGLQDDFRQTVDDFLTLQSLGDHDARARVRELRAAAFVHGEPDDAALQSGLEMLRTADLRAQVGGLKVPALVIAGRRDRLTPLAASEWLAAAIPQAELRVYQGAAHTPFLADPDRFVADVEAFTGVH